jgi:hypothetical protein
MDFVVFNSETNLEIEYVRDSPLIHTWLQPGVGPQMNPKPFKRFAISLALIAPG